MMTKLVDMREALDETAHDAIDYISFGLDDEETLCSGYVWAKGPSVGGKPSLWVLPVADGRVNALAVAVVRTARRHRVGRTILVPTRVVKARHADFTYQVDGGPRWLKGQGRYVDPNEAYTELGSTVSPTGKATRFAARPPEPPRAITMKPLPDDVMSNLLRD